MALIILVVLLAVIVIGIGICYWKRKPVSLLSLFSQLFNDLHLKVLQTKISDWLMFKLGGFRFEFPSLFYRSLSL